MKLEWSPDQFLRLSGLRSISFGKSPVFGTSLGTVVSGLEIASYQEEAEEKLPQLFSTDT